MVLKLCMGNLNNMSEENKFRGLLKNEITWVVMIVIAVAGFYKTVVIPINNLQIAIAQMQQSFNKSNSEGDTRYTALEARVTENTNEVIKLKERLNK